MDDRGLNVSVDYMNNIYFVRSCTNWEGNLDIKNLLGDIFNGRRKWFEVIDHPTTLIMPGRANVALPSQLFPPNYTSSFDKDKLSKTLDNDNLKLNWTGVPSIIIDYKHSRTALTEPLRVSCLDFFFNMSSFNTSSCIGDFGKRHTAQTTKCQKFSGLRKTCFDKKYNTHKTMYSIKRHPNRFITTIDDAANAVVYEQTELDEKYGNNSVQMYNETFSYVYPWDVTGIEVGHQEFKSDTIKLYKELSKLRRKYAETYRHFLEPKIFTKSFQLEIHNATDLLYNSDIGFPTADCKYLLAKFIDECSCGASNIVRYTLFNMKIIIKEIIRLLDQPVVLWEYGRIKGDDKFNLIEVGNAERSLDNELMSFERSTHLELFYQNTDQYNITVLSSNPSRPSDKSSKSGDVTSDATTTEDPIGDVTTTEASHSGGGTGGAKTRKTSRYRRGNRLYSGRNKTMRRTSRSSVRSRYN
jgi:hypothetical protein